MEGTCSVCDEWCPDLIECPICGMPVSPNCYSFSRRCCLSCKVEFDEDPE